MKLMNLTENRKVKRIEYRVSPLDEYGDIIDVEYFRTEQEARQAKTTMLEQYPQADDWLFEKNVRTYESDGTLIDDEYIDLGEY